MEKSPSRWWDFPSAILLVCAILVSTWRLTITNWTPHIAYVSNLALAGTILGLALGQSRFGKLGVRLLYIGYTLVILPWQLIAFYGSEVQLTDRLLSIGQRIAFSFGQFVTNKPVPDELFFVFLISLGYWIIGLIAGYSLIRRANYLVSVLPAAIAMMIVNQYDPAHPGRIWFIAVYFTLALGLLGRQQFVRRGIEWNKNKIQLAPETSQELSTAALITAGALVLLAWSIPAHPSAALADLWDQLSQPWETAKERMKNAFASVNSDAPRIEYVRDSMFLGDSANLDKSLVFTVTAPPEALALPRLYWRGRAYDHYENGKWTSTEKGASAFSPKDDTFHPPDTQLRHEYEFSFTSYIHDQTTLYLPGQPVWVSHAATARLFELSADRQDVIALLASPLIQAGDSYTTRSTLANPSATDLRESGTTYPLWVTDRYLQLPDRFSPTIRDYARLVTTNLTNPYDKAAAITDALRSGIQYRTTISPPTDGSDVIEWFLFEGKQGYCNYYATAEVLMLRSLGIPARMAVGYARGDNSRDSLVYTVRNENAHAWPEVYFVGYGWVEFEPTANQDPLVRPEKSVSAQPTPVGIATPQGPSAIPDIQLEDSQTTPAVKRTSFLSSITKYLPAIGWSLAAILLIAGIVMLNRRIPLVRTAAAYVVNSSERHGIQMPRWLRRSALYILLDPVERSFNAINVSLRWLGKSPALHYTPADRAAALMKLLPEASQEIAVLQREHQASLYSPRAGDGSMARQASRSLLLKALRAKFTRPWA